MKELLLLSALLVVAVSVAHSYLGERYIVRRLLRRSELPKLFGSDLFTRQTIRFAWHLTTAAWLGIAGVLVVLSGVLGQPDVVRALSLVIAVTFLASAVLSFVFTRARHLSWVVFLVVAVLLLWVVR